MTRERVLEAMRRLAVRTALVARRIWRLLGPMLAVAWSLLRPLLRTVLQVVAALIIVFEEWGWRPLADLLGRLARWRPWAAIETFIVRLPPYAALVVFALPSLLLLPLKFLALFLIAKGQIVLAGILFMAAKVVATALVARLFMLTQPALMQIGWFAYGYDTIMPWKDAVTARVRASWAWRWGRVLKERVRRVLAAAVRRWEPAFKPFLMATMDRVRAYSRQLVASIKQRFAALRSNS
jgi:hypothetical protein